MSNPNLRLEVPIDLSADNQQLWKNKISKEFNIENNKIDILINPKLVLGYKIIFNNNVYDHTLLYKIQNELAIINQKLK
jgi:F0F1-type ATP synthase delta subunit